MVLLRTTKNKLNVLDNTKWVYESPDGGETLYRRSGNGERELVRESQSIIDRREQIKEDQLWHKIRRSAKTIPALHQALEHAKMIYQLSRKDT